MCRVSPTHHDVVRDEDLPLPLERCWPALVVLCVGFFMMLLDQTIVAVATPHIQAEMSASYNQVIWVTSVYLLCFAVPLLFTGRLGDRFGPRTMYCAGMCLFTVSSLACGLAPGMTALIVARGVQGLSAAMLSPQTMSVINRIFPRSHLGAALGIWGATAGLAGMAGPIFGGIITQLWGWQWVFFINVPIGVAVVAFAWRVVPEFPRLERRLDATSVLLSLVAVFLLVFGLQEGQDAGWAPWIFATVAAGLIVGAAFFAQQRRAERRGLEPLVPLRVFGNRNFSGGNASIFMMGMTVAGIPLPLMLYFQQVHHLSPLTSGLMMICQAGVSATLSPVVGRLVDRHNPARLCAAGFAALSAGIALLCAAMSLSGSLVLIGVALVGVGVGNAFVWAPNSRITMGDLPPDLLGAGSGVYNTTRQLGAVLGTAAIGAVLQIGLAAEAAAGAAEPSGVPFGVALSLAAVATAAAAVISLSARDPHELDRD